MFSKMPRDDAAKIISSALYGFFLALTAAAALVLSGCSSTPAANPRQRIRGRVPNNPTNIVVTTNVWRASSTTWWARARTFLPSSRTQPRTRMTSSHRRDLVALL